MACNWWNRGWCASSSGGPTPRGRLRARPPSGAGSDARAERYAARESPGRAAVTTGSTAGPDGANGGPRHDRTQMPAFDTNVAHIARVYDYWLGGKDNY